MRQKRLFAGLWVAAGIAHLPLLVELGRRLWAAEHYQFFPFALAGAGLLAWRNTRRRPSPRQHRPARPLARRLLLGAGLLLLAAAVLLRWPELGGVAALGNLAALAYWVGGRRLLGALAPAWLLLALCIPLPAGLEIRLTTLLQLHAARWASSLLDLAGLRHSLLGIVIETPRTQLFVEQACSGIHSLFASLACTLFYLAWLQRRLIRSVFVVAAAVLWVLAVNVLRIVVVAAGVDRYQLPLTEGWAHEAIGLLLFALALGLIVATDRLTLFFWPVRSPSAAGTARKGRRSRRRRKSAAPLARRRSPARHAEPSRAAEGEGSARSSDAASAAVQPAGPIGPPPRDPLGAGGGCLVRAGAPWGRFSGAGAGRREASAARQPWIKAAPREALPENWNGWRLVDFQTLQRRPGAAEGQFARIWRYRKPPWTAALSINGPFRGWHAFEVCLDGQGWRVTQVQQKTYGELGEPLPGGFTLLRAQNALGLYAFCLYAHFDQHDRPLAPQGRIASGVQRRWRMLLDALRGRPAPEIADDQITYQLQVFVESAGPLSPEDEQEVAELFHWARRLITQKG